MDLSLRITKAHDLRICVAQSTALLATARELLLATPPRCELLVAFCPEGYAVGAAASVLAANEGRELPVQRASHLTPLDHGRSGTGWLWMSVEQALGLGPVRPWVASWARERGGEGPLLPERRDPLVEAA